jgi:hypothetical protein
LLTSEKNYVRPEGGERNLDVQEFFIRHYSK